MANVPNIIRIFLVYFIFFLSILLVVKFVRLDQERFVKRLRPEETSREPRLTDTRQLFRSRTTDTAKVVSLSTNIRQLATTTSKPLLKGRLKPPKLEIQILTTPPITGYET